MDATNPRSGPLLLVYIYMINQGGKEEGRNEGRKEGRVNPRVDFEFKFKVKG